MESPAKGTEHQDDVYMPDLDAAGEKKEDQHTCGRGDGCVCDNHDQPAVPAVHQRADERDEGDETRNQADDEPAEDAQICLLARDE